MFDPSGDSSIVSLLIPVRISSTESGHLGTQNDHLTIRISLYTTESPTCSASKANSVLASFVRELDVPELGCQIIWWYLNFM